MYLILLLGVITWVRVVLKRTVVVDIDVILYNILFVPSDYLHFFVVFSEMQKKIKGAFD